jgi:NAD-dependent DNA ligase
MPSVAFPGHRVSALLVFDPAVEACLRILGQVLSVLKEESLLLRVLPVVQTTRPDVPDAVQATLPGAAPDERAGEGRSVGDSVRKWHDFTGCIEQAVAPVVAAGARLVLPAPAQEMESLTRMWGAKAGEVSDGVLSCSQPGACRAAVVGTLEHFVGTLGVDGFGPRVVESLYDAGLLRSREDFFKLAREQLTPLERMGDLLASKLVEKVQAARALPLATFLEALGIEELARTVSAKLASRCPDVPSVLALSEADLRSMLVKEKAEGEQERASRIAFLVYHGLRREAGAISRLLEHVTVRPRSTPTAPAPGQDAWKFAGASFVFTGKMRTLERKAAQAEVVARSGLAPPDVTRDLSFLVVGDEGSPLFGQGAKGSKLVTAEKHNSKGASIRIISETEFLEMLKA